MEIFTRIRLLGKIAILTALMITVAGCNRSGSGADRLVGRWHYFGQTSDGKEVISSAVTYKDLPPTTWTLTEVDKATGSVTKSSGGTYTLVGDIYTENVDYGSNKGEHIIFNCKIENNKWFNEGKMADKIIVDSSTGKQSVWPGSKIGEIWVKDK